MPKSAAATPTLVYVKITLNYIRPAIWRRLILPTSLSLRDLHMAIHAAMGWRGDHLHVFEIDGAEYSEPAMIEGAQDERKTTLAKIISEGVSRFRYTYDFGDDWTHELLIEKKAPPPEAEPGCVDGARACPPEDCGGAPGYEGLLTALAAPNKPKNKELLEWVGEDFDPEQFSREHADRRVKNVAKSRGARR